MDEPTLQQRRRAIRRLVDEKRAEDAMAAYYAFYHPDERTSLYVHPKQAERARGYLAASRTGIDLFRPLVTLRLPQDDPQGAADLIYEAFEPGASVFIHSTAEDGPVLSALFDVHSEQRLLLYRLDRSRFEPIVNVLVMRSDTPDGKPRFIIRPTHAESGGEIGASASLNWQTRYFAEVTVYTNPQYRQRGWGRSVVAALADELLHNGQLPLYEVSEQNDASINLAESIGFVYSGAQKLLLEATLRERPG